MLASVPAARLAASLPCTRARGLAVPRAKMAGGAQAARSAPVTGFSAALPQQQARVGGRQQVSGHVGPLSRLLPQDRPALDHHSRANLGAVRWRGRSRLPGLRPCTRSAPQLRMRA
jgi:hypothetical protein